MRGGDPKWGLSMRKVRTAAVLAGALALSLAACGDDDSDDSGGVGTVAATATSATHDAPAPPPTPAGASAAPGDVDRDATFAWGYSTGADSLDPAKSTSSFQYMFFSPLYDSLVYRTSQGELEPGIAESWELSEDGTTFTLHLAEGRTFHDGTPIDADAVKANLERYINLEGSTIVGLERVEAITAPDERTVVLEVSSQGGRLPAVLSDRAGMMLAPSTFDTDAVDRAPVGSGPYTIDSFGDAVVSYARWPDYHDVDDVGPARIEIHVLPDDNTRLVAVRSGQLDATFIRPSQRAEAESAGLQVVAGPRNFVYSLSLNTTHPALAEADVRKAISHALDREGINAGVYDNGCPATLQPYPIGFWANNPDITVEEYGAYDLERARELLASAGYPDGFDMSIGAPSITTYTGLLELVQGALAEIGINVTPVVQESVQFAADVGEGKHEAWIGPVETGRPDVLTFWQTAYMPGGRGNIGDYSPPGFQELFAQAAEAPDIETLTPIVHEMGRLAVEHGPRVVVVCAPDLILVANDRIDGLVVPIDGNYDFRGVTERAD
jgi:peptide/nickel transport system substrate-binding protein